MTPDALDTVNRLEVSARCPDAARSEISVRHLRFWVDEPVHRGGTDAAPTPMEMQLGALLANINLILNRMARREQAAVRELTLHAVAEFDRRGALLQMDVARPLPRIALTLSFETDASDATIAWIKSSLLPHCPIARILLEAGTTIDGSWEIRRAGPARG
jgi:uncharacterized OsmC-like protein